MPMKPATPDSTAPIKKPIATRKPEEVGNQREDDDTDDGDRQILPAQISLRALAHGRGDLLHPRLAGIGRRLPRMSPIRRKQSKVLRQSTITHKAVME